MIFGYIYKANGPDGISEKNAQRHSSQHHVPQC